MQKKIKILVWVVSILIIGLAIIFAVTTPKTKTVQGSNIANATKSEQTTEKTKYKATTVTIGSTGDILIHSPIFKSVYNSNDDSYDFTNIFKYVNSKYTSYNYMVADLEQPLAGKDAGYSGYPCFNAPDSIADALKSSGVDMLLTANNHSYDQGEKGFLRTISTLKEKGIAFTGSYGENDKHYVIANLDGINVGMINYTFETESTADTKYINGIPMDTDTQNLLNSFNYNKLDDFYTDIEGNMNDMYADGADVIVAYMHWGDEYQLTSNDYQKKIAQKLCDLGVDAIVGGHTHCIEPIDVISSTVSGKQTPVIYSVGNELSNQRKETLSKFSYDSPYFEDGVIYEISFTRKTDGSVTLSNINYTPTWCNLFGSNYYILPLSSDQSYIDTYSSLGRTDEMKSSYKRTYGLLNEGVELFKSEYKQIDLRKNK